MSETAKAYILSSSACTTTQQLQMCCCLRFQVVHVVASPRKVHMESCMVGSEHCLLVHICCMMCGCGMRKRRGEAAKHSSAAMTDSTNPRGQLMTVHSWHIHAVTDGISMLYIVLHQCLDGGSEQIFALEHFRCRLPNLQQLVRLTPPAHTTHAENGYVCRKLPLSQALCPSIWHSCM